MSDNTKKMTLGQHMKEQNALPRYVSHWEVKASDGVFREKVELTREWFESTLKSGQMGIYFHYCLFDGLTCTTHETRFRAYLDDDGYLQLTEYDALAQRHKPMSRELMDLFKAFQR